MSSYEDRVQILLERGYHVAPSTDQDNHCAQGARIGPTAPRCLIPTGTALSQASFHRRRARA